MAKAVPKKMPPAKGGAKKPPFPGAKPFPKKK